MKKLFRAFSYPTTVWFPKTEHNFLAFICLAFIAAMFATPYPHIAMWVGFIFAASTIWNYELRFLQSFSWIIGAFFSSLTYYLLVSK